MQNHKFSDNEIGMLLAKIRELEERCARLENVQVLTVPIYDQAGFLTGDAIEGQLVIDSITTPGTPIFKFYQNGAWNTP